MAVIVLQSSEMILKETSLDLIDPRNEFEEAIILDLVGCMLWSLMLKMRCVCGLCCRSMAQ